MCRLREHLGFRKLWVGVREEKESSPHRLHTRDFTLQVWVPVYKWLGVPGQGSVRAGGIAEGHQSQALKTLLINSI